MSSIGLSPSSDLQNLADSSEAPPNQPSHEEREERTPQTEGGGKESDDRSVGGDSQEWDRGSEEQGERNVGWEEKEGQDLVSLIVNVP